ncbi:MAG: GPW/gp25 family protein [Bacteroidota bacterium]
MAKRKSFLGTGWGFPITFSKQPHCAVRMVSEEEDIKESLRILLSTHPGERILREDYGMSMEDLIFEPVTTNLLTYIEELIRRSILFYEPRINLEKINILQDELLEGKVKIELQYTVIRTNSRFNFVFPYYQPEATIIR